MPFKIIIYPPVETDYNTSLNMLWEDFVENDIHSRNSRVEVDSCICCRPRTPHVIKTNVKLKWRVKQRPFAIFIRAIASWPWKGSIKCILYKEVSEKHEWIWMFGPVNKREHFLPEYSKYQACKYHMLSKKEIVTTWKAFVTCSED